MTAQETRVRWWGRSFTKLRLAKYLQSYQIMCRLLQHCLLSPLNKASSVFCLMLRYMRSCFPCSLEEVMWTVPSCGIHNLVSGNLSRVVMCFLMISEMGEVDGKRTCWNLVFQSFLCHIKILAELLPRTSYNSRLRLALDRQAFCVRGSSCCNHKLTSSIEGSLKNGKMYIYLEINWFICLNEQRSVCTRLL